jgi:hypothetical protein
MKRSYIPEGDFRYKFEEIALDDTDNIYNGSCNITWDYDSGDMSVGVHAGFAFEIDEIYVQIPIDKPEWLLPKSSPFYEALAKAIEKQCEDHILGIIERKAEPDYFGD